MEALTERRRVVRRFGKETWEVWRCGWCKGFVHEERVSDMLRYVHDEPPATAHEVLPYRVR